MWKQIEIESLTYFLECKLLQNAVQFILYDLKQSWCEHLELTLVLQRAKELNKRIQFDKITILTTLTTAASVEAQLDTVDDPQQRCLKLKYRVDEMPFHFKWQLGKQAEEEFRAAVTLPLFVAVRGMQQQIDELREVIAKKDKELKQYKNEGAILKITTVATQPFSFQEFDDKYAEINEVSKGFQQLAESIMQQIEHEKKAAVSATPEQAEAVVQSAPKYSSLAKKQKISPRSRKRKTLELQHQRMAQRLSARQQKLEYESSQSQSQSISDSPPDEVDAKSQELAEIHRSWCALEKQRLADLHAVLDSGSMH